MLVDQRCPTAEILTAVRKRLDELMQPHELAERLIIIVRSHCFRGPLRAKAPSNFVSASGSYNPVVSVIQYLGRLSVSMSQLATLVSHGLTWRTQHQQQTR